MEQNKQQTALDWFWNEIEGATWPRYADFFAQKLQQAKQMEEEQHGNTWLNGQVNVGIKKTFQQYYNETYGKE